MSADFAQRSAAGGSAAWSRNRIFAAVLAVCAVLPAAVWLWGFTVDDALIAARVASHIASGVGPRFNPHGPIVDAVTPLGFAWLLAPLGRGDSDATFRAAKYLGLSAWLVASAVLGGRVSEAGPHPRRFVVLGLLGINAPLAAWSVSGMETGLVTLLTTLGLGSGVLGSLALGVAAAWRPELLPFALTLAVARSRSEGERWPRSTRAILLVVSPALVVALLRATYFGSALPLSFYAKPSDFDHGLRYAIGASAFSGLPWLLLATPREWRRASPKARPLLAAFAAHLAALVLCGGDWMPLYRLLVPALPCAALAAAYLLESAGQARSFARGLLAACSSLLLAIGLGPSARRVGPDRAALIARARPVLARDARIAALDVGWVGVAGHADVTDLAGVTDPQIAFLPGGHTSKHIPRSLLLDREPTAIVLLLARGSALADPFERSSFSRAVEQRVARLSATEFRVRTTLDLAGQTYVVLEPRPTEAQLNRD